MAAFSGNVTVEGSSAAGRTVRALNRTTGALLDEDTTDAIGDYSLDSGSVPASNVIILALPTEVAGETESYNAVILDQF